MAEVNLEINGKTYGMACDDGQEDRVKALGEYVNNRLKEISSAGAASNESHLFVLSALVLADEIFEMREHLQNLMYEQEQNKIHGGQPPAVSAEEEQLIVQAIDHLAGRVETIAGRLKAA